MNESISTVKINESGTLTGVWQRLRGGQRKEKALQQEKGKCPVCPEERSQPGEAGGGPSLKQGILGDWLGAHMWLSLVNPELEAGTEIRGTGSYLSNPGSLKLIGRCPFIYTQCLLQGKYACKCIAEKLDEWAVPGGKR